MLEAFHPTARIAMAENTWDPIRRIVVSPTDKIYDNMNNDDNWMAFENLDDGNLPPKDTATNTRIADAIPVLPPTAGEAAARRTMMGDNDVNTLGSLRAAQKGTAPAAKKGKPKKIRKESTQQNLDVFKTALRGLFEENNLEFDSDDESIHTSLSIREQMKGLEALFHDVQRHKNTATDMASRNQKSNAEQSSGEHPSGKHSSSNSTNTKGTRRGQRCHSAEMISLSCGSRKRQRQQSGMPEDGRSCHMADTSITASGGSSSEYSASDSDSDRDAGNPKHTIFNWEAWGDRIGVKAPHTLRFAMGNIDLLPMTKIDDENDHIVKFCHDHDVDVFRHKLPTDAQVRERFYGQWKHLHTSIAYNKMNPHALPHQVGGAIGMSFNQAAHWVDSIGGGRGHNPTGFAAKDRCA
jgi:hypothetical protein